MGKLCRLAAALKAPRELRAAAEAIGQVTTVEVAHGAGLFFVDQLQSGRVAHGGEAWQWERLILELEARLGGELILRERLDQTGEELRALAELAGSGLAACFANAVLVAEAGWRAAVEALHGDGLWVGVSALRRDGWSLRTPDPTRHFSVGVEFSWPPTRIHRR